MYRPPSFREDDLDALHDFVEARGFGLLVTAAADGPRVDALPFLLDRGAGKKGVLRAHLARANPQVAALREGGPALVVVSGLDAYVSPGWYPSKAGTGKVVPTWNYELVQIRGAARLVDDPAWIAAQIGALTERHERGFARPWRVTDAPADFIAAQMRAIVGLEILVDRVEGKFKLSQNRGAADRAGVRAGLSAAGREDMAEAMRRADSRHAD